MLEKNADNTSSGELVYRLIYREGAGHFFRLLEWATLLAAIDVARSQTAIHWLAILELIGGWLLWWNMVDTGVNWALDFAAARNRGKPPGGLNHATYWAVAIAAFVVSGVLFVGLRIVITAIVGLPST